MNRHKVLYYSDPLNDDFAGTKIQTNHVGKDFCYIHRSFLWKILSLFLYYCVALPLVWLTAKLYLGLKIENRGILRDLRHTGYYLYGNHTRILDAFVPPLVAFPKRSYFIAGPDAVSIPGIRNLVMLLGALPIPTELHALDHFNSCIFLFRERSSPFRLVNVTDDYVAAWCDTAQMRRKDMLFTTVITHKGFSNPLLLFHSAFIERGNAL